MQTFYKGAAIGTHWHLNDARQGGFMARSPGITPTIEGLITHIATGTHDSPYISLTCSYAVAWHYAMKGPGIPTSSQPAYVYEIAVDNSFAHVPELLDPVKEVLPALRTPVDAAFQAGELFYQHNGLPSFLLGVMDAEKEIQEFLAGLWGVTEPEIQEFRVGRYPQPPGPGELCDAHLTPHLQALVNALRDAEILVCRHIPPGCVKRRLEVSRKPDWP